MIERDTRERLWCEGEDAEANSFAVQRAKDRAHFRIRAQIDRRALLDEPLEKRGPIRHVALDRVLVHPEPSGRIAPPVLPEALRVAERVEVDGDGVHARTRI